MNLIEVLKGQKTFFRLLVVLFFLLGWYSISTITREVTPSINIPNYIVSVVYPGADPNLVDQQVVQKLESRMRSISLVKKVTTSATFNVWIINVEFSENKKEVDAINDLKSVIDQVYPTLPSDVTYPTFRKVDISDTPIYTFSIWGTIDLVNLYKKVSFLEDALKTIQGVSDVQLLWKPVQQLRILFDYEKLVSYNVDISSVIQQLRAANFKISTDKKELSNQLYTVELKNYTDELSTVIDNINNYLIVVGNWKTVRLKDLGRLYNTIKDNDKESFIVQGLDPKKIYSTLSFQIKKIPGADIQKVTQAVLEKIDIFKKQYPEFLYYETFNQNEASEQIFSSFVSNFFQTWLQVFLVILIFLWLRSGFVSLIGFIAVYAITFVVLFFMGESFNNITSFSLILVLGIMVDNIVIIVEWTIEKLREGEKDIWQAISYSLKNYVWPIVTGTIATVLIFVPIQFSLTGIIGQFMKSFPLTVNLTLLVSLFVTIVLVPVLIVWFIPIRDAKELDERPRRKVWGVMLYQMKFHFRGKTFWWLPHVKPSEAISWISKMGVWFAEKFNNFTQTKKGTWNILFVFWALFVAGIALLGTGLLKVDFLGNSDTNNVWINVKYKPGITLEDNKKVTYQITKDLVDYLKKNDFAYWIESLTIDIGSQRTTNSIEAAFNAGGGNYNVMSFSLRLFDNDKLAKDGRKRTYMSFYLTEKLQEFVSTEIKNKYQDIDDISTVTQRGGPSAGKPVWFYILNNDLDVMGKYVATISPEIQKIHWVYNFSTSIQYTNWKIQYTIDENKVKQLGVNMQTLGFILAALKNSAYWPNGIKVTEFNEFADDPIELKGYVLFSGNIDSVQVNNVYLQQIVKTVGLKPELKTINRIDGLRSIAIEADKLTDVALSDITTKIDAIMKKNPLPAGVQYKPSADIQTQADTGKQLWNAMLMGLIFMFLILVLEFKNIRYPFLIISSTILSIAGGLFFLFLFGYSFSFPAQLGMFGVIGVWVNQSIVIIDYLQELIGSGSFTTMREALSQAIQRRFVPIFITNITGVLWVISIIFSDEIFGSLGITFMGGLLLSVFIGMRYVPACLLLMDKAFDKKNS